MKKLAFITTVAALMGTSAFAADMAVKAPPVVSPPPPSWTGFYLGANIGGVWGDLGSAAVNFTSDGYDPGPSFSSARQATVIGGFHGGYNFQTYTNWVVGVEGDFDWTNLSNTNSGILLAGGAPFGTSLTGTKELVDSLASARGRLGYSFGNWVPYVTGGGAWSRTEYTGFVTNNLAAGGGPGSFDVAQTKSGWVVGGGFEYKVTPNLLLRAEYLHYEFNNDGGTFVTQHNPTFVPGAVGIITFGATSQFNVARVGFSYLFGGL
jgi:outer membrane immunogenic protein